MLGIGHIWGCPKCWSIWGWIWLTFPYFSPRKGKKCHQMSQDEPNSSPAAESEATCRVWVFIRFRGTSLTTSIFQAASNLWPLGAFGFTAMNMWLALAAKRFDFILSWVFLFRFRQVFRSLEVLCFFPSGFSTRKLPRKSVLPTSEIAESMLATYDILSSETVSDVSVPGESAKHFAESHLTPLGRRDVRDVRLHCCWKRKSPRCQWILRSLMLLTQSW